MNTKTCPYLDPNLKNLTTSENITLAPYGSVEHKAIWHSRLAEVSGAVMVASLFQVVVGFSGLVGFLLRFIGPLTIAPTIALIGLSLFGPAADRASSQWWISLTTVALLAIFSQYLRQIKVPFCKYSKATGCGKTGLRLFNLFPVLLAIALSWLLCAILTSAGALPDDPKGWGYKARTDIRFNVLSESQWFRFPYPGQWGMPTVSVAGVFGILAAVIASMIESVGDYYACARLAGAPPPPANAVSRGIGVEGITCILAGAWGAGGGNTSYSENIGAIGITKVGSRVVIQVGAVFMVVLGCVGKFGAFFITIPDPVVGGLFLVMFGMVTAVGISNLQFVDLNSTRNLFVFGVSMFSGLCIPMWMADNTNAIQTQNEIVDQIFTVLASTSMFVGGFVALLLDNTIPGTAEERGILKWRDRTSTPGVANSTVYDLPFIQKYLDKMRCTRYIPVCPNFELDRQREVDARVEMENHGFSSETTDM